MISGDYKKAYEIIFKEVLSESPSHYYDEAALPSYMYANKLISYVFWQRVNMALSLATNLKNKAVLDFGCGGGVTFKYLDSCHCKISGCENQFSQLAINVAKKLKVDVNIYENLSEIKDQQFDYIFALDVLEHIDDIGPFIDKFLELSHDKTVLIISGPTENILYRTGRLMVGFSGDCHKQNIYDIERKLHEKRLHNITVKELYPVLTLFRVSSWSK
jgi:2-polyprenyl-3-methyl-5-hydroxy-6-metoxy-1,4-benzoquinol methylase